MSGLSYGYTGPWFAYANAAEIVACGAVFIFLNCLAVGARFYVRRRQKQDILTDDWLTLPALVLIIGINVCLFYGVSQGAYGYPSPPDNIDLYTGDVSPQYRLSEMLSAPITLMMIVAYGCIKLSAIFFYRRLFIHTWKTPFGYTCIASIVIIICWAIATFIGYGLGCGTHLSALWGNFFFAAEYCGTGFDAELSLFISDLLTDVLVLVLPLPVIWSLQMTFARKLSVTGVMLLGGMALAASITRVAIYMDVQKRGFDITEDINLGASTVMYWSSIEAGLGLFAICLPSLRPLFIEKGPFPLTKIWSTLLSTISLHSFSISRRSFGLSKESRSRRSDALSGDTAVSHSEKKNPYNTLASVASNDRIAVPERIYYAVEQAASSNYEQTRREWREARRGGGDKSDRAYASPYHAV